MGWSTSPMTTPNYETMMQNKKANVRLRVVHEAPLTVVQRLLNDGNKRVKRAAEKRVKEGQK
jgi:hypothetical protein